RASRTRAVVVRVEGPAGSGKTALVSAFARTLRASGEALVLTGRACERESLACNAIDAAVDALVATGLVGAIASTALDDAERHAVARLFPVLRAVLGPGPDVDVASDDSTLERDRGTRALRLLFGALARERGVVLVLDDVQWADRDSAFVLERLIRAPNAPRLLVVIVKRGGARRAGGFVDALGGDALPSLPAIDVRQLTLEALSEEDSASIARSVAPSMDETTVRRLVAAAKGLPLAMVSLAAANVTACVDDDVESSLDRGLASLDDDARLLVQRVALAGLPVPIRTVRAAMGPRMPDPRTVDTLVEARWMRRAVRRGAHEVAYECGHDLVRELVVRTLPDGERAALCAQWADVLDPDTEPELLAEALVGSRRTEQAAPLLISEARRAMEVLAFHRAANLFARASSLAPEQDACGDLSAAMAHALALAGRSGEAARCYERAARAAGASREASRTRLRAAAEHALRAGLLDDGRRWLDEVLTSLELPRRGSPAASLAMLASERALIALRRFRPRRRDGPRRPGDLERIDACAAVGVGLSVVDSVCAAAFQARALRLALDAGDTERAQRAYGFLACFSAVAGQRDLARTDWLLSEAEILAERIGTAEARAHAVTAGCLVAFHRGEWAHARTRGAEGARLFRKTSGHWKEALTSELYVALSDIALGALGAVAERVPELLSESA
ncbi:MAG: AAA family ATPase, partial [Deltaproteobacteria bacterium]